MRKICRGKNINVTVIVLTHWQFISLENRAMNVFMISPTGTKIPVDFKVDGCKIKYTFPCKEHDTLGKYYVSVYESKDEKEVLRVDDHFLFELVDDPDYDTKGEDFNIVVGGYKDIEILDEVSIKNLLLKLRAIIENGDFGGSNEDLSQLKADVEELKKLVKDLQENGVGGPCFTASVNEEEKALILTNLLTKDK